MANPNKPATVAEFSKEQLLKSTRYSKQRDLLAAILKDGIAYSHANVEQMVGAFMKGQVK